MALGRARFWAIHITAYAAFAIPVAAQSVISTHSGLIHYFEGNVYLGDQALEPHLGKFPNVPQGGDLRTVDGRAEILLTPGVFMRVADHSAVRLVSNALADTQVELLAGSIAVEAGAPNLNTSVTLIYKNWKVHVLERGAYRFDSDPPKLWVRQGKAEVSAGENNESIAVDPGMSLPFAAVLVPEKADEPEDALAKWVDGRNESISADNAITAQLDEDPNSDVAGLSGFTYFPVIGVPAPGLNSSGPYGYYPPAQPGFNSIYLPGYTYRPLLIGIGIGPAGWSGIGSGRVPPPVGRPGIIVGIPSVGFPGTRPAGILPGAGFGRPPLYYPPSLPRIGVAPGAGITTLHPPMLGPVAPHPGVAPMHAAPVTIGVHAPAHR